MLWRKRPSCGNSNLSPDIKLGLTTDLSCKSALNSGQANWLRARIHKIDDVNFPIVCNISKLPFDELSLENDMSRTKLAALCLTLVAASSTVFAQHSICGEPPPVSNTTLKGEISGKAQLLSKYIGDAQLGGNIQITRSEIFSKYPEAETSRGNAFFEYQVCVLVMDDKKMTTQEKLNELVKVRREFAKKISSLSAVHQEQLAGARATCLLGDVNAAQAVFTRLLTANPDHDAVQSARQECVALFKNPKNIEMSFGVRPGVFMYGEPDKTYFAEFSLYMERSRCASMSNVNGPDTAVCSVAPGMRSFKLDSLMLLSPRKRIIFEDGSCGGHFMVRPGSDRYGVVMCMKEPGINCAIFPVEELQAGLAHTKCKFPERG